MIKQRLYSVLFDRLPDDAYEWHSPETFANEPDATKGEGWDLKFGYIKDDWEPQGWAEYALQTWGPNVEAVVNGQIRVVPYRPFFWPKSNKIWQSRSSAQSVVNIIEAWGGVAELIECEPIWELTEHANARRKRERNAPRIAKLRAQIEEMESA